MTYYNSIIRFQSFIESIRPTRITTSVMYTYKHVFKLKPLIPYIVFFTLFIWIFTYYSLTIYYDIVSDHQTYISSDNSGYLIQTSGCRIPEMYLRGPEVDTYMDNDQKVQCKSKWNNTVQLYTSNLTSLIFNKETWASLKIREGDPAFKCYYTPIKRLEFKDYPTTKDYYDDQVILGEKKHLVGDTTVLDEMIEVTCTLNESTIYQDYHIFVRPEHDAKPGDDRRMSVLVLGLDAVSRMNFHRQMPKTMALLSRLNSVEMLGYNKVEENTFPNLIPVLTGWSADELRARCWPRDDDYFDGCRFVWRDYRESNFSTAFVEDSPTIGLFNYLKYGFANKPTDYYLRPLMIQAEKNIGNQRVGNVIACLGSRLGLTFVLDHALKIASSAAARRPYMGVFWSNSLTHDFVEFPRFGDDGLAEFFRAFNRSGHLDRTVVVLMSDHGIRWGRFRDTYQGGQEARLPMLSFVLPGWFAAAYPAAAKNLDGNRLRLTTPYDLHETLLDLADPGRRLVDGAIESRTAAAAADARNERGVSLFLEVPENRTCETAGVPREYCACHDARKTVPVDDGHVVGAAAVLVESLNAALSAYPMCATLKLHRIHRAAVETRGDGSAVRDYELQVTTVPGHAKFEAIVRRTDGRFKMVGSVSRLNLYGLQSVCTNDAKMKLLCYCTH